MKRTCTGRHSMTGAPSVRLTYRERNKTYRTTRTIPYLVEGWLETIKHRSEPVGCRLNKPPCILRILVPLNCEAHETDAVGNLAVTSTGGGTLWKTVSGRWQRCLLIINLGHLSWSSSLRFSPYPTITTFLHVCPFLFWPCNHSSSPPRSTNLNGASSASTKTFVTALVLNGIIAAVEIAVFTCVRRYFRLVYEPRSLSVFESCAFPSCLTVTPPNNSRLANDNLHYPLASLDGLALFLIRITARSRISMD